MSDPGSISSRWLAGPKLGAAALNVAADVVPVFGVQEGNTTPAQLYIAMNPTPSGDNRVTMGGDNRVTQSGSQRITE